MKKELIQHYILFEEYLGKSINKPGRVETKVSSSNHKVREDFMIIGPDSIIPTSEETTEYITKSFNVIGYEYDDYEKYASFDL